MESYRLILSEHVNEIFTAASFWYKIKVIISLIIGATTYFISEEYHAVAVMVLVLTIFDFITAIMAVSKTGEPIRSKRVLKTVTKIVVYGLLISAASFTERVVFGKTFMEEAVISFLAITELISIIENVGKMGYVVPNRLLNTLRDMRKE